MRKCGINFNNKLAMIEMDMKEEQTQQNSVRGVDSSVEHNGQIFSSRATGGGFNSIHKNVRT